MCRERSEEKKTKGEGTREMAYVILVKERERYEFNVCGVLSHSNANGNERNNQTDMKKKKTSTLTHTHNIP